jgi:hypothetical protein
MVTLDLGAPIPPHLQIARANAIQAYANVEQSLSMLFSHLLGTTMQKAGVVFFRITNSHSRNTIISSLLTLQYGNSFDAFWHGQNHQPGMLTLVRQLDSRRNEIVHWHVSDNVHLDGETQMRHQTLNPPNFWAQSGASITVADLVEFCRKADFVQRSLTFFWITMHNPSLDNPLPENALLPWRDIFSRPVSYPPQDTHPLSPNYKAPQTPPRSSEA